MRSPIKLKLKMRKISLTMLRMKIMLMKLKMSRKSREHPNQAAPLVREAIRLTKKMMIKLTFSITKMKLPKQIDWLEKPLMPSV